MPAVTLTYTDTLTVDLPCSRTWSLASSGGVGEASFRIPHNSPAASSAYVNPDGGSFVRIASEDGSGPWNGIVTSVNADEYATTLTASQPTVILSRVPVSLNKTYSYTFPHNIVGGAFAAINSASTTYPLVAGSVAASLPLIPDYVMHGESVWSVLLDMMARTGHEVLIEISDDANEPDRLTWGNASNRVHDGLLLAPGQFRGASYGTDLIEQRALVTALRDYDWYTASAPGVAVNSNWPAHEVIKTSDSANLRQIADTAIASRLAPTVTLSGSVPRAYWSLREGDYLRVLIPWARFGGVIELARIISRSIDGAGELMTLTLQTAAGQHDTNRVLADVRQIQRQANQGRSYLMGGA